MLYENYNDLLFRALLTNLWTAKLSSRSKKLKLKMDWTNTLVWSDQRSSINVLLFFFCVKTLEEDLSVAWSWQTSPWRAIDPAASLSIQNFWLFYAANEWIKIEFVLVRGEVIQLKWSETQSRVQFPNITKLLKTTEVRFWPNHSSYFVLDII